MPKFWSNIFIFLFIAYSFFFNVPYIDIKYKQFAFGMILHTQIIYKWYNYNQRFV